MKSRYPYPMFCQCLSHRIDLFTDHDDISVAATFPSWALKAYQVYKEHVSGTEPNESNMCCKH